MSDLSTPAAQATRTRARGHRPWWQGGRSVRRWNVEMLAWAMLALGTGILAGAGLQLLVGGIVSTLAFWVALIIAVVLAFRRGIPNGLLVFRPVDVLFGVVLGSVLRAIQGWLDVAFGGPGSFPSYSSLDGSLPSSALLEDLIGGGVVAPVIEEFFFRGVLLVTLLSVVRRFVRRSAPGNANTGVGLGAFVAVLTTTGVFVLTHQLVGALTADAALSLALLSIVTGALVACTGRIWPAVMVHVVFNLTGVALAVAGTILG